MGIERAVVNNSPVHHLQPEIMSLKPSPWKTRERQEKRTIAMNERVKRKTRTLPQPIKYQISIVLRICDKEKQMCRE